MSANVYEGPPSKMRWIISSGNPFIKKKIKMVCLYCLVLKSKHKWPQEQKVAHLILPFVMHHMFSQMLDRFSKLPEMSGFWLCFHSCWRKELYCTLPIQSWWLWESFSTEYSESNANTHWHNVWGLLKSMSRWKRSQTRTPRRSG